MTNAWLSPFPAKLSGSYNAARNAMEMVREEFP